MATLNDVILMDVVASIPAAAATSVGALFWATDDKILYRNNGTTWDQYSVDYPIDLAADTTGDIDLTAQVTGVLPVANGGTGVSSAFVPLLKASLTLTDAQIKASPTTAYDIIAAPASGNRIKLIGASVEVECTAGAYTNIDATYSSIVLTADSGVPWYTGIANDSSTTPALTQMDHFLGSGGHVIVELILGKPQFIDGYAVPNNEAFPGNNYSVLNNKKLVLTVDNNGSGDFTGGNAANSMKVTVYYTIESLI